jgi:hypothetical protein
LGSAAFTAGQAGCLPLNLYSSVPVTNVELTLKVPPAGFENFSLRVLSPKLCVGNLQTLTPTQMLVSLRACPGFSLQGVEPPVAELCFTVGTNLNTAVFPVSVEQGTARTTAGRLITSPRPVPSQIAVIGRESLLVAGLLPDGSRALTLIGRPGATYAIEYTTDLNAPTTWTRLPYRVQLTSVSTNVDGVTPAPPRVFYRAVEIVSEEEEPPRLSIVTLPDDKLGLTVYGTPGATYLVQFAPSLSFPMAWSNLVQVTLAGNSVALQIPRPVEGLGFFRVIQATSIRPVLAALLNPDKTGSIFVRGTPAKQYTIEYNTNLTLQSVWHALFDFTLTNETGYVTVTNFADPIFYRVRQGR